MKNRYYTLNQYFKERYGGRVHKITIDAGFSCPNLDGTIGKGGCIYCNNLAFNPQLRKGRDKTIREQIIEGIEFAKNRYKAKKFIAYYQPYTNTYGNVEDLKSKYDVIKEFPPIIGLAVGTRPDCIDENKLNLLISYKKDYEVWIEYGLQSAKDKTLKLINRGHDFKTFKRAVEETKAKDIKVCAHVIIGLPQESLEDYIYTAKKLRELKIDGVKLHPAHVVKDTELARMYKGGNYIPLGFKQYVKFASIMVEYLPPNCVIQRVGASAPEDMLLAPDWIKDRKDVALAINKYLEENNSWQGKLFEVT